MKKRHKHRTLSPHDHWRIKQLFYHVGLLLGDSAEQRVNEVFQHARDRGELPEWIHQWTRSIYYSQADRRGVDFVITTDVGVIYLQIKSSEHFARKFIERRGHGHIVVVVIDIQRSDKENFGRLISALRLRRSALLAERQQSAA